MSLISLLPPVIVFSLGMLTKRVCLSLFIGIFLSGLIATDFHVFLSIQLIAQKFYKNLELNQYSTWDGILEGNNLYILGFIALLGILIELMRKANGLAAFVRFAEGKIKNKRSVETTSLILSHSLFIDDYLSSLTVGAVMRPLVDRFHIARVKLAFLVDSMAAPIAMISPISSWAAAIIGFLAESGIREKAEGALIIGSPLSVYFSIIPSVIYSFVVAFSLWFIVRKKISFGRMKKQEEIAVKNRENPPPLQTEESGSVLDFFLPIFILLFTTFIFLLVFGDFKGFGGNHSFIWALQNSRIAISLFLSGVFTLCMTLTYFLLCKRFEVREIPHYILSGVKVMGSAMLILILAWTLGDLLRSDLKTGEALAAILSGSLPPTLLPCMLFWIATLTSLALGTSWGTSAILFPIAASLALSILHLPYPVEAAKVPLLSAVFGAILSGAVCGDHVSMISDTTAMAAKSSGADHMQHFSTQWPYVAVFFIATSLGYLLQGFTLAYSPFWSSCIATALSICVSLLGLKILHKRSSKEKSFA